VAGQLKLAELAIEVERKPIKHLHLGVYPPNGRVRIAAPEGMSLDAIRLFAIGKLPWIRRQRSKLQAQPRDNPREYLERESHYVWGRRYLLSIVEHPAPPVVELQHRRLRLRVRPGTEPARRGEILEEWYRGLLRTAVESMLSKWEPILKVRVEKVFVQRMRTKWGSCNARARNIRLNSELARKPKEYLEYILVHELGHLRFPTHGPRFLALMDQVLPQWRELRDALNQLPLRGDLVS
jgi:predicted metal-dependent hydrolase